MCCLAAFFLFAMAASPQAPAQTCHVDVAARSTALRAYALHPSGDTARAARRVLEEPPCVSTPPVHRVPEDEQDAAFMAVLQPLRRQLAAGDDESWKLAFALAVIADGGDLEDLYAVIGGAVSRQPRMFLERAIARPGLGSISVVSFLGADYSDQPVSRCRELQERLAAIVAVEDPHLVAARDEALSVLRAEGKTEGCRTRG